VTVNAIAPGFVATRMQDAVMAAGPEAAGTDYFNRTERGLRQGGLPPSAAAELAMFLLGPEARGISGKLLSAQWDPWQDTAFRRRLAEDRDFATLRRVDDVLFTAVARS
jgi:3-oxoacyl-[acyl-carrier protein] reductase